MTKVESSERWQGYHGLFKLTSLLITYFCLQHRA